MIGVHAYADAGILHATQAYGGLACRSQPNDSCLDIQLFTHESRWTQAVLHAVRTDQCSSGDAISGCAPSDEGVIKEGGRDTLSMCEAMVPSRNGQAAIQHR